MACINNTIIPANVTECIVSEACAYMKLISLVKPQINSSIVNMTE